MIYSFDMIRIRYDMITTRAAATGPGAFPDTWFVSLLVSLHQ